MLPSLVCSSLMKTVAQPPLTGEFAWWARQDLNLQPTDYESAALTGLSYGP